MTKRQLENYAFLTRNMERYGISYEHSQALLRIERTLHRWSEHECNGDIERDENTGKTYRVYQSMSGPNKRYPTADRETGALNRLKAIMANYPHLIAYHQGDPRGCALYLVEKAKLGDRDISANYSSGLAICY